MILVKWDFFNISFKRGGATSLKATSKTFLLSFSKSQSLKRYLSVDNNLTLNESTQRLYTEIKLLLLNTWPVVIS